MNRLGKVKNTVLCWFIFWIGIFSVNFAWTQTTSISGQITSSSNQKGIAGVSILVEETQDFELSNESGYYQINNLSSGTYNLIFFLEGYSTVAQTISLTTNETGLLNLQMDSLAYNLEAIEIEAEKRQTYGIRRLRNVEGMSIYAAKKSEVIDITSLIANTATNNARQVYKGIAGLNIWENDGAGLQLSIGARGLDPNRTSNFNTRQNGYDISADALGYPESYYTPPVQALKRIEIVRGAASLQYGPQFGGLLNFVFKKGTPDKPFELMTENTIGSFGLFSSFTSIGGTYKDWNYYTFYQHKQGDGWRSNSEFEQNTAYAHITKRFGKRFKIGLEYTYMDYLAQQPGGLQDFEFQQDAQQSKRTRNWFKVNWNLAALLLDYRLSDKTKLNSRNFFLFAQRQALGELGPINRPDPLRERDLIFGQYQNFGNETRLIHRYKINGQLTTFLLGLRYYQGFAISQQGDADDTAQPNFTFLNPEDLEVADYEFPSRNIALFAENLFNLNEKWTLTPGLRLEYIRTASDGFYKEQVTSGGQVIFEQQFYDAKSNSRALMLTGIGIGYKPKEEVEVYANFSQNYRSINFTDLAVVNPNLIVDSLLQDETGFNSDLGIRGTVFNGGLQFDASLFYLKYNNRIGVGEIIVPDPAVVEKAVAFRTNIGDAQIVGLETYVEANIFTLLNKNSNQLEFSIFLNGSVLNGIYKSGASDFVGNKVELIPPHSIKTGATLRWKSLQIAYQYAYTEEHFSDATNAVFVVDATRGLIPAYSVQDISGSYSYKRFRLQTGINNLTDSRYFTRRSTAYPGPGIIPADGRSFYVTLGIKI